MTHFRIFLTLIVWILATTPCFAKDEPTIIAQLNTNSISVEKAALLTVTVTGSRSPDLIMPQVPGLTFHSRGTSTMINMVNGSFSKSSATKYVVQADQEGTYVIPPIAAEVKGKIYKSEPLSLIVTDNKAKSTGKAVSSDSKRNEIAFIELEIKGDHYVGEQVPVTIRGFFNERYKISLESVPALTGDGVIMAPFSQQPTQGRVRVGNRIYDVVDWKTTLSAIKEGEHKIQISLNAAVYTREQNNSNPFNDPFFDSFFNSNKKTPLEVSSNEIVFNALPLPKDGQPENYTGAIGDFSIHLEADPIIVDIGEPITITTTVTGKGSFDSVHAPVFVENKDWKTYKPSNLDVEQQDRNTKKIFQQVIIPRVDGIEEVPPITFSYFNPETKAYETSKSMPVAIHVKKSKTVENPTKTIVENKPEQNNQLKTESKVTKKKLYTNLVPQHLETGVFHSKIEPVFERTWFIVLVVICFLLILFFSTYHIYNHFKDTNPEKELKRKQKRLLDQNFPELDKLCENKQTDDFTNLAKDTVQQFYSIELNLPPQAITATTLEFNKLNNTVAKTILESADKIAFSGERPGPKQMEDWLKRLKEELTK